MSVSLAGRGSAFEELLEYSHRTYANKHLAVVQKVAVPVKLTRERAAQGRGFVGYYAAKSTVDFVGVYKDGRGVALDAKSTRLKTRIKWDESHFPRHQQDFLRAWARQGGLALILVEFSVLGRYFAIHFEVWDAHQAPSWTVEQCATWGHLVQSGRGCPLDYLAPWTLPRHPEVAR
jgi:recombination protein U